MTQNRLPDLALHEPLSATTTHICNDSVATHQDQAVVTPGEHLSTTNLESVEILAGNTATSETKEKWHAQFARAKNVWSNWNIACTKPDIAEKYSKRRSWRMRLDPLKSKSVPPVPQERSLSREYNASFFSRLTFQWNAPLISVGYQRPLELNDLWSVNPNRGVDILADRLNTSLKKRRATGKQNALRWALYDTFKKEFWLGGSARVVDAAIQVLSPFTLKYLISFASATYYAAHGESPAPSIAYGMGLVFGITIMQIIQSFCLNHFLYNGLMVGAQARSVLIAVIFDKAVKLSGRARAGGKAPDSGGLPHDIQPGSKEERAWLKQELKLKAGRKSATDNGQGWGNGRIVNLMSVDTYRIDQGFSLFHFTWTSPLQVLLTLVLLLINLAYSALVGFGFICITLPLLAYAVKSLKRRRRLINSITDQRASLTQEIWSSVRFIKYFGWETAFVDRVANIRKRELNQVAFLLSIRNAILAVSTTIPIFASMLTFVTYNLTSQVLEPAVVFSSLALFNSLRIPLNILPQVIGQVIDAHESITRIEDFLRAEEAYDNAKVDPENTNAIVLEHAEFTWERNTESQDSIVPKPYDKPAEREEIDHGPAPNEHGWKYKSMDKGNKAALGPTSSSSSSLYTKQRPFSIRDLSFSVGRNELIAVIGATASGKSSLLSALAGEMRCTSGEYTVGSSRAICPQYAWIQNDTIKKNITFGKSFHQDWYDTVVDACALRADLDMLPAGDLTEIGERGITLSGGQKQRLSIARAIYFNADIVLMDDPLSAVDAQIGRDIMEQVVCGLLRNKCRILATHQLNVLHRADRIIWMKGGQIHKIATFPELIANDTEFQYLLETNTAEEKEDKKAEANDAGVQEEIGEANGKREKTNKSAALMQQEEKAVRAVDWAVYKAYVQASGSLGNALLVFVMLALSQGANITTSLWLSFWTSNEFGYSTPAYIGIYAGLGICQALLTFGFSTLLTIFGVRASGAMQHLAMTRVLRAPLAFFDTTPLGRITNRFSKDVDTMDNYLGEAMRIFFVTTAMVISVFVLTITYYHYFAVALVPLTILFLFSASYYRASAREIKRHEAVLRSVVYARFSEAVSGMTTLRAYQVTSRFARSIRDAVDSMDGAYFLIFANQAWLAVRLDAIGNILFFVVGVLVVTSQVKISPSTSGVVLSYIISIVSMLQGTVSQLSEFENQMNATERIHYYATGLDEEASARLGVIRPSWPERGEITFDNVQMRYRDGLPLVLKGLNMRIKAGERIGVVGRTGAGKSSIISTLFRVTELAGGTISIDGIDIATVGLHELRSKLAIIPQDPTLFKGTIRSNLDPFDEHTDFELWNALRQADLIGEQQTVEEEGSSIRLDTLVEEEGLNFSLGQRQLLSLSRALVRNSQIIVCDEATSSVDYETDRRVQRSIVRGFEGKTLLCIAHRVKTIIG